MYKLSTPGVIFSVAIIIGVIALVVMTGCKPARTPQANQAQAAQEHQPATDQIDEMGKAADGKDFIAAPPTAYYEVVAKQMYKDERKQVMAEVREIEEKGEDGLTAFMEEAKIQAAEVEREELDEN